MTKCHQDVLHGNDRGLLLKYVATYTPKFSESFAKEWLNDEASAFSSGKTCAVRLPAGRTGDVVVLVRAAISSMSLRWHDDAAVGAMAWHGHKAEVGRSL